MSEFEKGEYFIHISGKEGQVINTPETRRHVNVVEDYYYIQFKSYKAFVHKNSMTKLSPTESLVKLVDHGTSQI